MGEILVNQVDAEQNVRNLDEIQNQSRELEAVFASFAGLLQQIKAAGDSQAVANLNQKINKAQDLFMAVTTGLTAAASQFKENTAGRRLALDELQDQALHVRMLPVATIFALYPRVVRDAASACGKSVKLKIAGEKTELDKRILEEIADPLMHIIRNCVDHGIEFACDRTAAGKPEQGLISLTAAQRGDRVEIVVEDDGAGLDPARIKAAAVRHELISGDDALSDEEAVELIFHPGLSTAAAVTAISGRGVGLDVVKNNIEKLEGTVTVDSVCGAGTRFVVSLPVTLAVIPGLVVGSGETKFVIPMAAVQELVAVAQSDVQSLGSQRGFMMRGSAVPLVDLTEFLGGNITGAVNGKVRAVVVGAERFRLGLQVEQLIGEQEIVIKPLGSYLPRLPLIAGATILGNGEVVLVLNVNELVREAKHGIRRRQVAPQRSPAAAGSRTRRSVLVVDDSLVVRELQRNILEAAGYEVEMAVDGNDALSHLSRRPVDCVVTDVEMPGMDGFRLTSAIRQTGEICDIPVVMVSSRGSEDDKLKGVEAGANAYVVKGSFDQQGLLDTIERLVA
jgi:chemotaxis protein histidine kinase CheA